MSGEPAVVGVRDGLSAAALLDLLRATFDPPSVARHWCACGDTLGAVEEGLPRDLHGWTEGRVWGSKAEVRWRERELGAFSALILGDGEGLPAGFTPLATGLRARPGDQPEGIYLWGERGADGRFHATRLPRPLEYHAVPEAAAAVRLPHRVLYDASGQVRFVRLTVAERG